MRATNTIYFQTAHRRPFSAAFLVRPRARCSVLWPHPAAFCSSGSSLPAKRSGCAQNRFVKSLLTIVALALTALSAQAQFVLNPVPGLSGGHAGSLAWGDFDND